MSKYKIIMTGGGTAGHVTPNLALAPKLKEKDFEIKYIGSYNGIEKEIITDAVFVFFFISFSLFIIPSFFFLNYYSSLLFFFNSIFLIKCSCN